MLPEWLSGAVRPRTRSRRSWRGLDRYLVVGLVQNSTTAFTPALTINLTAAALIPILPPFESVNEGESALNAVSCIARMPCSDFDASTSKLRMQP